MQSAVNFILDYLLEVIGVMKNFYKYLKLLLILFALSFNVRNGCRKWFLRVFWLLWIACAIFLAYFYKIKVVNLIRYETSSIVNAAVFFMGQLTHFIILFEAIWKWKSEKDFFAAIKSADKNLEKCLFRDKGT